MTETLHIRTLILLLFLFLFISDSSSQIKVYERDPSVSNYHVLFSTSETRSLIDLNGKWDVSFNDYNSFSEINVPSCYEISGEVIFHKRFPVNQNLIDNYSFIFVAEGINYSSKIYINGNFIVEHTGGFNSIIASVNENILLNENFIEIKVDNRLDYNSTIPLSNQINYPKNFGGIYRDIYLVAVPKIHVFDTKLSYKFSTANSINLSNIVTVKSTSIINRFDSPEFSLKTLIIDDSTGNVISESTDERFSSNNFVSEEFSNTLNVNIPSLWSPDSPKLYTVRSIIKDANGNVIDIQNTQTGFRDVSIKKDHVLLNGEKILLNFINYYDESAESFSAVSYESVRRDIELIKELGFNSIRVAGRTAHPYVVKASEEYGLFIFQEIPFNEVPVQILSEQYKNTAYNYLSSVIKRDRNSPSVIAWGIGNDFDVTNPASAEYVQSITEIAKALDDRQVYYTTRNLQGDICREFVDLIGINIFTRDVDEVSKVLEQFSSRSIRPGLTEKPVMVSSFGVKINNENDNGYSDLFSTEYQAKFLVDVFNMMYNKLPVLGISTFADWNSERPLNFRQNANPFLVTNGIYTIYREPKFAAQFVSRVIKRQDIPKIMEGKPAEDDSFILTGIGVILNIIFFLLLVNMRKFREGFAKFLIRPTSFFQYLSDQLLIPVTLNIVICLLMSLGIGLFLSSLFYFFRGSDILDMVLANFFTSDGMKIFFSDIVNSPIISLITFTVINLLLLGLSYFIIWIVTVFMTSKINTKSIFIIVSWSSLVMFPFVIVGTVIYKLASLDTDYVFFSLLLLALLHLIYIARLIKGGKTLLNFSYIRSYMYSLLFIVILYGGFYIYLKFFNGTINIIHLASSYF